MSICTGCQHCGNKAGECNYNGVCVIKTYNLQYDNASAFKFVQPINVAPVVASDEQVFNPFQRGNGCTEAGYTYREIFGSHTR